MKLSIVVLFLILVLSSHSNILAGPRGMTRDFDLLYETRETDGPNVVDIDRFTFTSKFGWELTRRSELKASIPFCNTSADFSVNPLDDDSIADFKDLTLDYYFTVREAKDSRPGAFYELHMNLPTGKGKLSPDEQAIINAINEASEGFSNPAYSTGFGMRAMYGMSFYQGPRSSLDVALGYNYTGAFDNSDTHERDTSNNVMFRLSSKRQINPGRQIQYGMSYMQFGDGKSTDKLLNQTTKTKRDSDILLLFIMNAKVNPNLKNTINFNYTIRGEQDFVDAGGTSIRRIDLGDIICLDVLQHKKLNPKNWLDYGLSWKLTQDATFLTGTDVDTKRNDLGAVIGMTKKVNTGLNLKGNLRFGLTDDSRDFVCQFGGHWNF